MLKSHTIGLLAASALVCFAAPDAGGSVGDGDLKSRKIKNALGELDPAKDDDWTEGGLPKMERIEAMTGDKSITRKDVSDAAPGFNRSNAHAAPSGMANVRSREPGESADGGGTDAGEVEGAKASSGTSGQEAGTDEERPADRPIDQTGSGNPNDAMNNAERRNPESAASGGVEGSADMPVYDSAMRSMPSPDEIAERIPDPILLLEAAVTAGSTGRYSRNSSLSALLRGYRVAQREIKETQGRLDKRAEDRDARVAAREKNGDTQAA